MRFLWIVLFVCVFTAVCVVFVVANTAYRVRLPAESFSTNTSAASAVSDVQGGDGVYTVVADGFEVPWDVVFLPNGDMLVTERGGVLSRVASDGSRVRVVDIGSRGFGEGGLLGVALHPLFVENGFVYLYSTQKAERGTINRVERFVLRGTELFERTVIIDNIPGARYHDGGRIAFGPDGYLYITTGDAGDPDSAQDKDSLAGKILRVTNGGDAAPGNPFGTAVFSLGHRNPQGLAWDASGALWSTEHGRSGVLSGLDEINIIERGGNYGWPLLQGDDTGDGFIPPMLHSGGGTWAPASAAFVGDMLFFGGLRGETLYAYVPHTGVLRHFYTGEFGRMRTVRYRPEEDALYITTSNRDGRGMSRPGDDRILKISLTALEL